MSRQLVNKTILWDYYDKVDISEKNASCRICGGSYSYKTTIGNLTSHLKRKHVVAYDLVINGQRPESPEQLTIDTKTSSEIEAPLASPTSVTDLTTSPTSDNLLIPLTSSAEQIKYKMTYKDKNLIWDFFVNIDKDKKQAKCLLCENFYNYKSSITNLVMHLKRRHINAYTIIDKEQCLQSPVQITTTTKRQQTRSPSSETEAPLELPSSPRRSLTPTTSVKNLKYKTKHVIWDYFERIDNKIAKCAICGDLFCYRRAIGKLKLHLKQSHIGAYVRVLKIQRPFLKKSVLWDFFDNIDKAKQRAKCLICGDLYSYKTSTGNLKTHLRNCHLSAYFLVVKEQRQYFPVKLESSEIDAAPLSPSSATNSMILTSSVEHLKYKNNVVLWNYFDNISKAEKKAKCRICGVLYNYRTTIGNLKNHLKKKHFVAYVQFEKAHQSIGAVLPIKPNQTSVLWNYFDNINEDEKEAKCRICGGIFNYKCTTFNMKIHLKRRHIDAYTQFVKKQTAQHPVQLTINASSEMEAPLSTPLLNPNTYPFPPISSHMDPLSSSIDPLSSPSALPLSPTNLVISPSSPTSLSESPLSPTGPLTSTLSEMKAPLASPLSATDPVASPSLPTGSLAWYDTRPLSPTTALDPLVAPSSPKGIFESLSSPALSRGSLAPTSSHKHHNNEDLWEYFDNISKDEKKTAKCRICGDLYSFHSTTGNLKQHLKKCHNSAYTLVMAQRAQSPVQLTIQTSSDMESHLASPLSAIDLASPTGSLASSLSAADLRSPTGSVASPSSSTRPLVPTSFSLNLRHIDASTRIKKEHPTTLENETSSVWPSQATGPLALPLSVTNPPALTSKISTKLKRKIDQDLLDLFIEGCQPFSLVEEASFKKFASWIPGYKLPTAETISNVMLPELYKESKWSDS